MKAETKNVNRESMEALQLTLIANAQNGTLSVDDRVRFAETAIKLNDSLLKESQQVIDNKKIIVTGASMVVGTIAYGVIAKVVDPFQWVSAAGKTAARSMEALPGKLLALMK